MAHSKHNHLTRETGATCPNCQTYFADAEIERDETGGYAVLEATPCAVPDCGAMLCACCSQVHTACCGQLICSEHAIAVTSTAPNGTTCTDQFCPACFAAMLEAEAMEPAACCPACQSTQVVAVPYDLGREPGTGYREAGERFECRACGASGDAADVAFAVLPEAKPMGRETQVPKFSKTQTA